jgi:hypothetical protein
VSKALDLDPRQASVYLSRAVAANRLKRAERGLYVPVASVALLSRGAPTDNNATDITAPQGDGMHAMDAVDTEQMGLEGMGTHDDGPDEEQDRGGSNDGR